MFAIWALCFLLVSAVCYENPASTCGGNYFPCSDGQCIEKTKWCDTELDCNDRSDENYCFTSSNARPDPNNCNETFFMCRDGPCIPLVGRCDGHPSCRDASDEENCGTTVSTLNETSTADVQQTAQTVITRKPTELPETLTSLHYSVVSEEVSELASVNETHEDVQADPVYSNMPSIEGLQKGYMPLVLEQFKHERAHAGQWLLKVRDQEYGWGDETARALTALYMSDDALLRKQMDQKMLMSKQLHLKLFTALIRNSTSPIPLGELSLFINALFVSCNNPRNFYGQDLVNILRLRTDVEQKSTFISPIVYLTLCLNNATTYTDVQKVQEILFDSSTMDKIDIEALVSLAATCMSRAQKFEGYPIGHQIASRLYHKISLKGLPENIYELSLVAQALNEARISQELWRRSMALYMMIDRQDDEGSFGDILATYYAMPVLSGRSLLSLGRLCATDNESGLMPLEILKNGEDKVYITYSLYFGSPVEVSQSLMMRVKNSTNFLDIMRIAETINPVYKFRYDESRGKPTVYSIGGVVNDPERGLYWKLHVAQRRNSTIESNLLSYEGDIRSFTPTAEDVVVFWIKSLY